MTNGQSRQVREHMRPNIQITHRLNGRVKDFAAKHDLKLPEAYRAVILTGLDDLEERDELPEELLDQIQEDG